MASRKHLFAFPAYRRLMAGQTASTLGSSVSTFALFIYTFDTTGSASLAATVSSLSVIATLLVSVPAGAWIDKINPLSAIFVSVWCGLITTTAAVCLHYFLGTIPAGFLCAISFLLGSATALFAPAERAVIKRMIPPELLGTAMAINQTRYSIGTVGGPLVGAVLYAREKAAAFGFDLITYIFAAWMFRSIPYVHVPQVHDLELDTTGNYRVVITWIKSNPLLCTVVWFTPILNFAMSGSLNSVYVMIAHNPTGSTQLGWFQSSYGLCGLLGSFIATAIVARVRGGVILCCCAVIFAMVFLIAPWLDGWLPAAGVFGCFALALPCFNAVLSGYFVIAVPHHYVGKATAIMVVTAMGFMPLGMWISGILIEIYSPAVSFYCFAAVFTIAVIGFLATPAVRYLPVLREIPSGTTHQGNQ
ncbi:Major Facilitator Superfamily transporter [Corynebacterium mustelae]|uniref:Major Facilitator Superfamily transporter n=1 Tax=Corynebacterium mustelae TaxID=571915 RepID=A0A0G3GW53_9CORY|nr:MFS transporter [Corynebacterium mustelae]AKK05389.1 Major Facilitator Superfamily transporter [Corynebacterium mustelae]